VTGHGRHVPPATYQTKDTPMDLTVRSRSSKFGFGRLQRGLSRREPAKTDGRP
jgi:hypothetical protein